MGKTLVWNPKIFLRDKFFTVQAGSTSCQWGPLGWAQPTWMPPGSEQMAVPYLPAQGRASTARRISHGIGRKEALIRSCLTTIQPCEVPLVSVIFSCSFLSLKTSPFTRRLFFFLLLSRSSMAYQCCHPLTTAVNWPLITLITSPYSPCVVLHSWLKWLWFAASPLWW